MERELITLMMTDDSTADTVLAEIDAGHFTNGVYRRISGMIAARRGRRGEPPPRRRC